MKLQKRIVCVGRKLTLAVCLAVLAGVAQDGVLHSVDWSAVKLSSSVNWYDGVIAGEGGVATFEKSNLATITQNIPGWTLSGLDTLDLSKTLTGEGITFVGSAFLRNTGGTLTILCPIEGSAGASLTKSGAGSMQTAQPFHGFAVVTNALGKLVSTNDSGTVFTDSPLVLSGGNLAWQPTVDAGTASVAARAGADNEALLVRSAAWLQMTRGNADEATLTLPEIAFEDTRAPVLRLLPSGGTGSLGSTEKIKVAGTAPAVVNGMADARIAVRSAGTGQPYSFVTYDATDGFKPVAPNGSITDADAAAKIVQVSSDTALTDDAAVHALVIDGSSALTMPSDKTLSVGDGSHAAGVIFTDTTSAGQNQKLALGGTLAFGNAPGVIWQSHAATKTVTITNTTITGTKGVTFASGQGSGYGIWDMRASAAWTGPTRIVQSRFTHSSSAAFPSDGDVFVEGGELYTVGWLTYSQRFHFSGNGVNGGAYRTGGSPTLYFNGRVTLTDTMRVYHDNATGTLRFQNGVDGRGGFRLVNRGRLEFASPCTFEDGIVAEAGTDGIIVSGTGSLGSGTITSLQTGTGRYGMSFTGNVGTGRTTITHPNAITCAAGGLEITNSYVALTGKVTSKRGSFGDRSKIGVGADVSLGNLTQSGWAEVYGAAPGGTLTFDVPSDRSFSMTTSDGAAGNTLALVKTGAGTMTWSGSHTHSGATTIRSGGIRLENDLFKSPDLQFWLDAADTSTWSRDEATGFVTNWNSKVGGHVFKPTKLYNTSLYSFGPSYTNDWNGKPVLSFYTDTGLKQGTAQRLACSDKTVQRMVFIVARIATGQDGNSGIFGVNNEDRGARFSWSGGFDHSANAAAFNSKTSYIIDGQVSTSASFSNDKYHLFTLVHDEDDGTGAASKTSVFSAAIGGYCPWNDANGDSSVKSYRAAKSDIAEVLAFSRILTEDERKSIENYLNEKWAIPDMAMHSVPERFSVLSPDSPLVVAGEAVLDLNGSSETVASLSGCGQITNSAASPVTLTVSGACDFTGVIAPGVKLVLGGSTASFSPLNGLSVTNGLCYWVDASYKPETHILRDGNGAVTGWVCRAGSVVRFDHAPSDARPAPDGWAEDSFPGGKPSVHFHVKAALTTLTSTRVRTMFQVGKVETAGGNSGVWGVNGAERGFRLSNGDPTFSISAGASASRLGELVHVNGVDYTGQENASLGWDVYVLTARFRENRTDLDDKKFVLGQYVSWNTGTKGWIAESLAYDRQLSDDEIATVEKYLTEKWSAANPLPEESESPLMELASVTLDGGAAGSVLTGDFRITDSLTVKVANGTICPLVFDGNVIFGAGAGSMIPLYVDDWRTMDSGQPNQRAVQVNGTVAGGLTSGDANLANWALQRHDNIWSLARTGMLIIFR